MYFGSWKGRFLLCCKLQCVCLFSATFQTTLCRYILFCELVHAWDNCSKDTVSPNNISRRWLWQQEKRRRDKRSWEVERRETLWASLRASHNEPRTRTHILCEPASRFHKSPFMQKITFKKNAPQNEPRTRTRILCEPARSKHMSRFHKSHLIRKFTGKMPHPRVSTLIKHRPLYTYRKNPSVWTQCFGKKTRGNNTR